MHDYQPGYPIDCRTASMRDRAARGHLGDFEYAAARVMARFTGERVVIQDDNSVNGMADLRIDYRDGVAGFAEVVTDIDRDYSAMVSAVRNNQQIPAPALGRIWWVTLSARAQLRNLTKALPNKLLAVQQSGALFEIVHWEQHLESHASDAVRDLASLGVVQLASRQVQPDEDGKILIHGEGTGGPAELNWTAFTEWLTQFLFGTQQADVRRKLAATNAEERHAFVGASFSTPWAAYHSLSDDYRELPTEHPELPAEITHLWVWSYPLGRCIAWFPDDGWFDPSTRWATP
ncbi:hypothetical protein Lfu02_76330 [Longispora fulva]|uniref:Uncharacterized protein n=1 Tax=Longispora fulva TaxID=619741 RepID=A0A8J7GG91_9ACTN|nr:hypothetical protein [Longispora fulva]MBG6138414.1 hypothetical protein [Longispora fulva]GIG63261.1 hypothetical protein Lfu02_76330 [Longispora fulva]